MAKISTNISRRLLRVAALGLVIVASGCAMQPQLSGSDVSPTVLRIDSHNAHVAQVTAQGIDAGHLQVSGYLTKRFKQRGQIPGQLRVTAIDGSGTVLDEQWSRYSRRSANSNRSWFSQVLDVPVGEVVSVRVEHVGLGDPRI